MEARIPENEKERQRKLDELEILDTKPDEDYERITRLVCQLLGVKVSAISLVDGDRQWFKSIQGLDVSETARRVAFCAHTILEDNSLVVPDASQDPRFSDNPLVLENPKIRFYAGIPLEISPGIKVGTLCAIDTKPKQLDEKQIQTLKDLAKIAEMTLVSRLTKK